MLLWNALSTLAEKCIAFLISHLDQWEKKGWLAANVCIYAYLLTSTRKNKVLSRCMIIFLFDETLYTVSLNVAEATLFNTK